MDIANLLIGLIGALGTALVGFVGFVLSRHAQRYSAQRSIGDLQSAMAHFRAEYPEIVTHMHKWGDRQSAILHGRVESQDRDGIVRYYSYLDLGLEFCNTALAAHSHGLISGDVFEDHYRPLVRHFFAENQPFVSFALAGPYLSSYVRDEWSAAEDEGWDWAQRHRVLAQAPLVSEHDD